LAIPQGLVGAISGKRPRPRQSGALHFPVAVQRDAVFPRGNDTVEPKRGEGIMWAFANRLVAFAELVALGVALVVTSVVSPAEPADDAAGGEPDWR
jgi:hypothetical protein